MVGQDFGTGTGSVYGQFLPSEVQNSARLEQWQYSQRVTQTHCNQVTYSGSTNREHCSCTDCCRDG